MQESELLTTESLAVPMIEVFTEIPDGAKRFSGVFYGDEVERLRAFLRSLRDREKYVVATEPEGRGYRVYRRAS